MVKSSCLLHLLSSNVCLVVFLSCIFYLSMPYVDCVELTPTKRNSSLDRTEIDKRAPGYQYSNGWHSGKRTPGGGYHYSGGWGSGKRAEYHYSNKWTPGKRGGLHYSNQWTAGKRAGFHYSNQWTSGKRTVHKKDFIKSKLTRQKRSIVEYPHRTGWSSDKQTILSNFLKNQDWNLNDLIVGKYSNIPGLEDGKRGRHIHYSNGWKSGKRLDDSSVNKRQQMHFSNGWVSGKRSSPKLSTDSSIHRGEEKTQSRIHYSNGWNSGKRSANLDIRIFSEDLDSVKNENTENDKQSFEHNLDPYPRKRSSDIFFSRDWRPGKRNEFSEDDFEDREIEQEIKEQTSDKRNYHHSNGWKPGKRTAIIENEVGPTVTKFSLDYSENDEKRAVGNIHYSNGWNSGKRSTGEEIANPLEQERNPENDEEDTGVTQRKTEEATDIKCIINPVIIDFINDIIEVRTILYLLLIQSSA